MAINIYGNESLGIEQHLLADENTDLGVHIVDNNWLVELSKQEQFKTLVEAILSSNISEITEATKSQL